MRSIDAAEIAGRVGGRAPARVDVRDHLAVGVGGARGRLIDEVGRHRIGEAEAGALAADEGGGLRAAEARDLVHDLHARAAHEEGRGVSDPARRQRRDQRAVERGEVLVQRCRRQPVAVDERQRRGAADPLAQLDLRLVGERAAEIRPLQEGRLVGSLRRHLEHAEVREQLRVDVGHHRVLGGGVIGAEAEHRVRVVARADAADTDPGGRRAENSGHHPWVVGLADVDAAIRGEQQRARRLDLPRRRLRRADLALQRRADHGLDLRSVDRRFHPKRLASPARAVSLPSRMIPISSSHASNSGAGR